jgi:hypothetical protein
VLPLIQEKAIRRLSVFALSRIPLLCELGYLLGDKVPMTIYQKHRAPNEGWRWPDGAEHVNFEIVTHGECREGDTGTVAVLASISGSDLKKVRRATRAECVYEIRPVGIDPSKTLLAAAATLEEFRQAYLRVLSQIEKHHARASRLDLFLAAPAPVAIICGRDIQCDVVPEVAVFDLVESEYVLAITIDTRTRPAPITTHAARELNAATQQDASVLDDSKRWPS